jgi:hypothetical protein
MFEGEIQNFVSPTNLWNKIEHEGGLRMVLSCLDALFFLDTDVQQDEIQL